MLKKMRLVLQIFTYILTKHQNAKDTNITQKMRKKHLVIICWKKSTSSVAFGRTLDFIVLNFWYTRCWLVVSISVKSMETPNSGLLMCGYCGSCLFKEYIEKFQNVLFCQSTKWHQTRVNSKIRCLAKKIWQLFMGTTHIVLILQMNFLHKCSTM